MSSLPPPGAPSGLPLSDRSHAKGIFTLLIGFSLFFDKFQRSMDACGPNTVCKVEKVVSYLTVIIGVRRPAAYVTKVLENILNKVSTGLLGMKKDSWWGWVLTVVSLTIFSVIEYHLRFVWDWVESTTACLKRNDCEDDDVQIWISNMKLQYCENLDDEPTLECDEDGTDCTEETSNPISDPCTIIFNELPVISLGVIIWLLYISVGADDEQPDGDGTGATGPGGGGGGSKSNESSNTTITGDDSETNSNENVNKETDESSDSKKENESKKSPEKGKQTQTNPKGDAPDKQSKPSPKPKTPKKSQNGYCTSTQEIEVHCPWCVETYIGYFPDPLQICCGECGDQGKGDPKPPPDPGSNNTSAVFHSCLSPQYESSSALKSNTHNSSQHPGIDITFHKSPFPPVESHGVLTGKLVVEPTGVEFLTTSASLFRCFVRRNMTMLQEEVASDSEDATLLNKIKSNTSHSECHEVTASSSSSTSESECEVNE